MAFSPVPTKRRYRTPLPFAAEVLQEQYTADRQLNRVPDKPKATKMAATEQMLLLRPSTSRSSREHFNAGHNINNGFDFRDDLPVPPPLFSRRSHDTTRSIDSIHSREAVIENDSWLPYKRPERTDLQKFAAELDMLETSSSSSSTDRSDASRSTVTPITEYNSRPSPPRFEVPKPLHQRINSRSGSFSKPLTKRRDSVHDQSPVDYGFNQSRKRSASASKPPMQTYLDIRQHGIKSPPPDELNGVPAAQYREPVYSTASRRQGVLRNRSRSNSSPKWNNRTYIDSSEDLSSAYKAGPPAITKEAVVRDRSSSRPAQTYTNGVQHDAFPPPIPYRSTSRPPSQDKQKLSFDGPLSPVSIEPRNPEDTLRSPYDVQQMDRGVPTSAVPPEAVVEQNQSGSGISTSALASHRFPELHGRHERDRSRGVSEARHASEPRHATASLNAAAKGLEPPVASDKPRPEQPLAAAPLKRYPDPPAKSEFDRSAPKDELPRPQPPAMPAQKQTRKPKNEYKIPKRRAASAWRPPSVWYENVEGVTLSTRPRSSRENRIGLSIPELEARDIQDIPARGRSHPNDEDCQFAENGHHFARSPPPIGARNSYIRDISPKPVVEGQEHAFLDNYSRAADDEMPNQRCDPPRTKRPAAEHSGAQAIDPPEPIMEQPHQEHEEDFSDHGGAEPPDIARSRAMEEQDAQMKSKTEQIKSLLGGMMKTFNAKNTLKKPNGSKNDSPPGSSGGSSSDKGHELHIEALNHEAVESEATEDTQHSRPPSVHRLSAHTDSTAFLWDDSDGNADDRPPTRDTMIWSPPKASQRNSAEIYRNKRLSFSSKDENATPRYSSTFASLGGPR